MAGIEPSELTDRELLLVMNTTLNNHLAHHDMYTKAALFVAKTAIAASITGAATFVVGLLLILIRFGVIAVGQGG